VFRCVPLLFKNWRDAMEKLERISVSAAPSIHHCRGRRPRIAGRSQGRPQPGANRGGEPQDDPLVGRRSRRHPGRYMRARLCVGSGRWERPADISCAILWFDGAAGRDTREDCQPRRKPLPSYRGDEVCAGLSRAARTLTVASKATRLSLSGEADRNRLCAAAEAFSRFRFACSPPRTRSASGMSIK
jgi:hypothetical protein